MSLSESRLPELLASPLTRRRFLVTSGVLLAGCAGSARSARPPATEPRPVAEPPVRVGLVVGVATAAFHAAQGSYVIREDGSEQPIAVASQGEPWGVTWRGNGELRVTDPRGYLSQPHQRPIRIEPQEGSAVLQVGERSYAGALEVLIGSDGLTVVNELPLEQYLRGVVPREMPAGEGGFAALKAQAIAARTYALRRRGSRAELGFDVFGDVQDQVYGGLEDVSAPAERALADTRGRVLLSGGQLVDAYYHSTCGGSTAALEEAFPKPPVPYLTSAEDRDEKGGFYCARSKYFRWQTSHTRGELEGLFARNLGRFVALPSGGLGTLVDVAVGSVSPGGRVLALRIETTSGSYQVARNDIRWVFADESSAGLRSTLFLLRKERSRGYLETLTLTGGGWGHGVGMCQIGALGRSSAGATEEDILAHYYKGTRIEQLYA